MDSSSSSPPRTAVRVRNRRPVGANGRQHRRQVVTYVLLAAAAVLMVHALVGENGYLAGLRARREYDRVMAELTRVRLENQQLIEQAHRLREDPAAIEDAARRDLGLIHAGETLVIVKDVSRAARR